MYIIHIDFYFRGDLSKLNYAILVAVKFVFPVIVKVRTVPAPILCEEVNVIVVAEIEKTKQSPTIPVPVIVIPTRIAALLEVITTLVDADVAVVDVAVVDDDVVRIIKFPVRKLEKPTRY